MAGAGSQLAPSCKRVRVAHNARIGLALAGGALGDSQLGARAEGPPGQARGRKRVSFCPETQVIQVDSHECYDFPLARRRRGQPALVVSSAVLSESDMAGRTTDIHGVCESPPGSEPTSSSTPERCILSPTGAASLACTVDGQSPVTLSDGVLHASSPNSLLRQPRVASSVGVSAPPALGAPARILTATAGAPAHTMALATAVPSCTVSGGTEDARAHCRPSEDGELVHNSRGEQPDVAASAALGGPPALGAPARTLSATAAPAESALAPAVTGLPSAGGGNAESSSAATDPSMNGPALAQIVSAATGSAARAFRPSGRPRQLTLADFWR